MNGPTCSHPHNLPYNDECAVWWLRGTPEWRAAHTNLPPTEAEIAAREFAALDAMIREARPRPGDTRTCPDCGHPQHYTGAEHGWAHDAGWWTYEEA